MGALDTLTVLPARYKITSQSFINGHLQIDYAIVPQFREGSYRAVVSVLHRFSGCLRRRRCKTTSTSESTEPGLILCNAPFLDP
jgi:hypothetical protein